MPKPVYKNRNKRRRPFTILVCGDRAWPDIALIWTMLNGYFHASYRVRIVEGGAQGADSSARAWASMAHMYFPHRVQKKTYEAEWERFGTKAGPIRNRTMFDSELPDLVLAFHHDITRSRGTKDMLEYAEKKRCPSLLIPGYTFPLPTTYTTKTFSAAFEGASQPRS